MSVFTAVTESDAAAWLLACGAGTLRGLRGVEGGVENTNYFVAADGGRFVLTLFEWMPAADAERSLALTDRLADAGLPVARPWPQRDGWTAPLAGKPAALADWIDGRHPETATLAQCAEIGNFLGRLHDLSEHRDAEHRSYTGALHGVAIPDARGPAWRARTAAALPPDPLRDVALAGAAALPPLPQGVIHADLFRDNALFDGDTLNGVIDFHYACTGPYMYDVAVAALDWCFDGDTLAASRLAVLCRAYAGVRAPTTAESAAFGALLQSAALRFWLSREYDGHYPRPGRAVQVKDAGQMRRRLAALRDAPPEWPGAA